MLDSQESEKRRVVDVLLSEGSQRKCPWKIRVHTSQIRKTENISHQQPHDFDEQGIVLTRSARAPRPNVKNSDDAFVKEEVLNNAIDESTSFEDAEGVEKWQSAMHEEISALYKSEIWELVSCPKGMSINQL